MKYRIEISSVAEAEADRAFLRLSQAVSPVKASQWYSGLFRAIESLPSMLNLQSLRLILLTHNSQHIFGESNHW